MMIHAIDSIKPIATLGNIYIPYILGGHSLTGMDCVGLLRYWLNQNNVECPYKNTHDFCRNMLIEFDDISNGVEKYNKIPIGSILAIWQPTGQPSRYNDNFGNVTHLYVKIKDGTLLHASESNKRVLERSFSDKAIPNGCNKYGLLNCFEYDIKQYIKDSEEVSFDKITITKNWNYQWKIGDRGNGARDVQKCLCFLGYNLSIDGVFGEDTKNAVIQFQILNMLKPDGVVGRETWKAFKYSIFDKEE